MLWTSHSLGEVTHPVYVQVVAPSNVRIPYRANLMRPPRIPQTTLSLEISFKYGKQSICANRNGRCTICRFVSCAILNASSIGAGPTGEPLLPLFGNTDIVAYNIDFHNLAVGRLHAVTELYYNMKISTGKLRHISSTRY